MANLRSTRRSRDSEEKEGVELIPVESREVQEEERDLKRVDKEDGSSALLHCDSQSSGIFSQVGSSLSTNFIFLVAGEL